MTGYCRRQGVSAMSRTAIAASFLLAGPALAAPTQIGIPGLSYIDPEFEPRGNRIVFQDFQAQAWVGEIDPATGQCLTATCRDVLLATDVLVPSDPRYYYNGPEWGISAAGTALYLTKYSATNIAQSWWVNPDGTGLTQLTSAPGGAWGGLVSVAPSATSVRVLASSGKDADVTGVWFDAADGALQSLPGFWLLGQGASFLQRSARYAIYPFRSRQSNIQLAIIDMDLQTVEVVTTTPGRKSQTWGFMWGGVLHAVTVTDLAAIEVFKSGPTPWPKVAKLIPPVPGFLYSTEPLGNSGCFVTSIQNMNDRRNYTDAAIYLACLNGTWTRVDDGAPLTRRSEPEPWWSGSQWFIYYTVNDAALWVTVPFLPAEAGLLE